MISTAITEKLGITHPIVQGGMQWVALPPLSAAVSEAGGLGVLSALTHETPEGLAAAIDDTRNLTDKPFGVNLTVLPSLKPIDYDSYLDVIIDKKVPVIETAGNSPAPFMEKIKGAGLISIHKCTSLRHALKAEELGCDIISIDGFECAGHPGEDDVGVFVIVNLVAKALTVPVIASGGVADGRGLAGALALGAAGVNMGTRFVVTEEAPVHRQVKEALAQASERDTTLILRTLHNSARVFKNDVALQIREMEAGGSGIEEIAPLASGKKGKEAWKKGDPQGGVLSAGQTLGLINDIPTVKELLDRMVTDAEAALTSGFTIS